MDGIVVGMVGMVAGSGGSVALGSVGMVGSGGKVGFGNVGTDGNGGKVA